MKRFVLGAGLAVGVVLLSYAAAPADETRRVLDEPARGGTLEVDGISGGIDARAAHGNRLIVTARIDRRGSGTARIAVEHRPGRVVVCTTFGDSRAGCGASDDEHQDRTLIYYTVELPAGTAIVAHSVDGSVRVVGAPESVEAIAVNGDVTTNSSHGSVDARTVNGRIDVTALPTGDQRCTLHAVNGRIDLRLLPTSAARVSVSTVNGAIEAGGGFSFTERSGSFGPRTATGHVGGGTGRVSITTVNGDVRVSSI